MQQITIENICAACGKANCAEPCEAYYKCFEMTCREEKCYADTTLIKSSVSTSPKFKLKAGGK
jgi:hypothetical protein